MSTNNTIAIPLTRGYTATINAEDAPLVASYTWYVAPRRIRIYARGRLKPRVAGRGRLPITVYMHRLITSAPQGAEVDHINGDGLDNRRCNLRICDGSVNRMNYGKPYRHAKKVTSQYRGVSYRSDRNKWQGRIQFRGTNIRRLV